MKPFEHLRQALIHAGKYSEDARFHEDEPAYEAGIRIIESIEAAMRVEDPSRFVKEKKNAAH